MMEAAISSTFARCRTRTLPNLRRKPGFRLGTEFWDTPLGPLVLKTADAEARPFLETVASREASARRFFGSRAEVISGRLFEGGLVYPFVSEPSIRTKVANDLKALQTSAAIEWLKRYISFLESLPSRKCRPSRFLASLGLPASEFQDEARCLEAGPIDLIPDNILVGSTGWHICDHEFFFDWEVPLDLVVYRGISTLVHRLQAEICAPGATWRNITYSGHLKRLVRIPEPWIALLSGRQIPLSRLGRWSHAFEKSIIPDASPSYLSVQVLRLSGEILPPWAPISGLIGWMGTRAAKSLGKAWSRLVRP
jgi:hypothetical protein